MVEFAADDKVDGGGRFQDLLGLHRDGRADETDLELWINVLHHAGDPDIDGEAGVDVNRTRSSNSLAISTVCWMEILWGGASTTFESFNIPAG